MATTLPLGLQSPHLFSLAVGKHLRQHSVDAQLPSDGLGRAPVVARDHGHLEAESLEACHGLDRVGLQGVGDRDDPGGNAVHRDEHRGLALGSQSFCRFGETVEFAGPLLHQPAVAQ